MSPRLRHNGRVTSPAPVEIEQPDVDDIVQLEDPWVTIVWNDPVNLMSYVAYVFRNYFGYTEEKANRLMMAVHTDGKASGPGVDVIARQRLLPAQVQLPARIERQRVRRDRHAFSQKR